MNHLEDWPSGWWILPGTLVAAVLYTVLLLLAFLS